MTIVTEIGRRHLAIAGVAAIGAASLIGTAPAVAADDAALKDALEELRKAILAADKAKLAALTAEELSYGHSDGRVQNKAEFIDGVVNRKATVKSLDFPDLKISAAGDAGVARHRFVSDSEQDGKATHVDIGVLAVWQQQGGQWKLLARQGYKLG
jgi:ketosteroid isomerase-like protein